MGGLTARRLVAAAVALLVAGAAVARAAGRAPDVDVVYGSCPMETRRLPTDPAIFPPGSFTESCTGCAYQEFKRLLFCEDCRVDAARAESATRRSWLRVPPRDVECFVVNRHGALACAPVPAARRAEVEQRRRAEDADEQRRREHARRKRAVRPGQSAVTDKAVLTGKKPARFDYEDEDEHNNNNDGSNSNSINKKVEL